MAQLKAKIPRIMITAPSSGSGKTTVTVALLKAFLNEGKKISAYKSGPDYIDPMFHREVINIPSRNLDQFILGDDVCKYILGKNSKDMDISILEGVMGYYDGIGTGTLGSTYELAKLLNCPVVMVVNCKSMSLSSIRVKPSIDEPSKVILFAKTLSNCDTGTSTFLMIPLISVNIRQINSTFSSFSIFVISIR